MSRSATTKLFNTVCKNHYDIKIFLVFALGDKNVSIVYEIPISRRTDIFLCLNSLKFTLLIQEDYMCFLNNKNCECLPF